MLNKSSNKIKFYKDKKFWMWVGGGVVGFGVWSILENLETVLSFPVMAAHLFYLSLTFIVERLLHREFECNLLCLDLLKIPEFLYAILRYSYFVYIIYAFYKIIKGSYRIYYIISLLIIIILSAIGFIPFIARVAGT